MRVIFYGRVQGVGFRYFTYKMGIKYNINGTVRNLSDGTVELVVDHTHPQYEEFIHEIKKGNGFMQITKMQKDLSVMPKSEGFEIVY